MNQVRFYANEKNINVFYGIAVSKSPYVYINVKPVVSTLLKTNVEKSFDLQHCQSIRIKIRVNENNAKFFYMSKLNSQ